MERETFFSKQRIIAKPGFNRWLVPPAALAIHLCIGMAYGFSVFWLPLSEYGLTCAEQTLWQQLITSTCSWKISSLGWIYTLFFIFLGCSAALWGKWLEKAGPRKVGFIATLCWCGGLTLAAIGVREHQLWLMWLGAGATGGIGLGLGYISPVSTLLRWFPDKKGMAAGLAIMGFGGGAMAGAPLATALMRFYATNGDPGVWQSLLTLAALYFVAMMAGTLSYRIPPFGWQPGNWRLSQAANAAAKVQVHVQTAMKMPQFWLLWLVLCLNVSAGIGVLGMASPLFQEVIENRAGRVDLAVVAAGFTGLLSLFNILGRFFWASLSDYIGRKATFSLFFLAGALLYLLLPRFATGSHLILFLLSICLVISMYGGGFATIPAYLADVFGTKMVGAIHGRLLTAWSAAGIIGPVLVNYLREYQLASGLSGVEAYRVTLYILSGLLVAGQVFNMLVHPAAEKYAMSSEELADAAAAYRPLAGRHLSWHADPASWKRVAVSWALVLVPLAWGVYMTLAGILTLFWQA